MVKIIIKEMKDIINIQLQFPSRNSNEQKVVFYTSALNVVENFCYFLIECRGNV